MSEESTGTSPGSEENMEEKYKTELCEVGLLLDLRTPEKRPPVVIPSTYTKPEKPAEGSGAPSLNTSFTISGPDTLDIPLSVSDVKRSLQDNINDSIELGRDASVQIEGCMTPEGLEIKLLDEEEFDFDLPLTPVPNKRTTTTSLESSTCDQPSGEDEEIFFGPMGHTEKCVSKAVENVVHEEVMTRPLSPLNPQQIVQLFKEAQRVAYHINATAPKGSDSSTDKEESVISLNPQALNFSNISSINDSVSSTNEPEIVPHLSPQPRQRKNTFTKAESALDNLSETLNKALPHVEPVPKNEQGAIQFSAKGKGDAKPGGLVRGTTLRRNIPGRGLKPVAAKTTTMSRPQSQTYLKRPSVGKSEKRLRHDSRESIDDDTMSIASNDSESSYYPLSSGKRGLPQPKLKPSSGGLRAPGQSRLAPTKPHIRSNTHTPGTPSGGKVQARTAKNTPNRRSLGSQPMGSKMSLPQSRISSGYGIQKPSAGLSKPLNRPTSSSSTVTSKISTTRTVSAAVKAPVGSKLGTHSRGIPGKSPVNPSAVSKPSGLVKPTIKGTMTRLDNLKPGTLQRKTIPGSKLAAPGAGPMKATGLNRPGSTKITPKSRTVTKKAQEKENTPDRPIPKPSSGTITKSNPAPVLKKVPILTTPVKADKNVQPKRLTLQDSTNKTPRKNSDSSVSSFGTPVSAVKRRSFLPTPNKSLSISSTGSDSGAGVGERSGSVGSEPSPAVGMLVDIGFGSIPDTPSAFKAKPKVMSTPQANKENAPKSIWSPVRKQRMTMEDEAIQCTKRFSVYQKKN